MIRFRFALAAGILAWSMFTPGAAGAQPPVLDTGLWVTNGTVYAMAQHENTVYLGGSFTEVAPATGAGVGIDPQTGIQLPNFPPVDGRVLTVASDIAGGWYIGGLFTSVGGQLRNNIAHVTSTGVVSAWNPNANGAVLAIQKGLSGTIYVGGDFTIIGGQTRPRLAELDGNGLATAWNPSPNSTVNALGISHTTVFAGGQFSFVGATPRANLAAIDGSTGALTAWNPGCNGPVHSIEVAIRGIPSAPVTTVLVGGVFTTLAGMPRANLGELRLDGVATAWNPNPNGAVYDIHERSPVVYVGGAFTTISGFGRNRIAAIDPATAQATAFNPDANGAVRAIQWSGFNIFLGGEFTTVGGLPRRRLAKVDELGVVHLWEVNPNGTVRSLVIGSTALYVGGDYTGIGGELRNNLAAFDLDANMVSPWNPDANGVVLALAPYAVGPSLYGIFVGGDFTIVAGQARSRLAELDPASGSARAWDPGASATVRCMAVRDTSVFVGGSFTSIGSTARSRVAEVDRATGLVRPFSAAVNGDVLAMALGSTTMYIGGFFTAIGGATPGRIAELTLGTGNNTGWDPDANGTVRSLIYLAGTVYAGGDFTTIGGQARSRIAAISSAGSVTAWNPGANGIVRSLVAGGAGILAGGDFTVMGGQARGRVASLAAGTGALDPWDAQITDREVYALLAHGTGYFVGGSFTGVGTVPHAGFAAFRPTPLLYCFPGPFVSPGGPAPRAIVGGDFDNDGIRDLVTLSETPTPQATVLRGNGAAGSGDGTFTPVQTLPLALRPMHAAVADFDADGLEDLVISQTGATGVVSFYRNLGGSFADPVEFPVYGRSDGLAAADLDNDGILDLAVCLTDSLETAGKGGILVLRGGGTGGVWDGNFTVGPKLPDFPVFARRVLPVDMDADGILDLLYVGNSASRNFIRMLPNLVVSCRTLGSALATAGEPGTAVVSGDFNGDGRPDMATMARRELRVYRNDAAGPDGCTFIPNPTVTIPLPSAGRDLVTLDFTLDGHLDLVCTLDSTETVLIHPGLGDGTFDAPITIGAIEAWGLAAGDFVANGSGDLVVGQRDCGTVTVIDQPSSPLLATNLDLVTPNGGESWPGAVLPPSSAVAEAPAPWILEEGFDVDARGASPAVLAPPVDAPRLDGAQQITWTKGAGVQGVDVQLSRDGGATWQTIGSNMPGTAMTWLVTPPGTLDALVRVRDAVVPARADASDGAFQIPLGTIGVEPGPRVATAFRLLDRHPVRGAAHFRLQAEVAGDALVQVFDASGRLVRELARGRVAAGTHDLVWDARGNGRGARAGIYFVRARVGAFETTQKVVVVP